jgi:phytoene dehydrogenase-like protein
MKTNGKKIVIIGSGIAGLCAAVYALKCGYEVEVLEMHDMPGGLAMSWRRGPYTFETCLHWLIGSKPGGEFNQAWREVCDIDKLTFVDSHEFVRIESEATGDTLRMYTNADMLEAELIERAPQDVDVVRDFVHSIRTMGKFKMLDLSGGIVDNWFNILRDIPVLPRLSKVGKMSGKEYGSRFSDPLLRSFFSRGDMGKLTAIAMVMSLGWMNEGNAGYCIGGSQALIRLIAEKINQLGGRIRYRAKVERILVENGVALGVQLAGGEKIDADWVLSAADGHATIFDMLEGRFVDETIRRIYHERETFASYLQVSLGIEADLSDLPPMLTRILESPIQVDPETSLDCLGFRFFHFDPTFAPPGKTAVTCILPTRNFQYWTDLRRNNLQLYHAEKERVADAVIQVLERRVPGIRTRIDVIDVSTPATIVRYTGNWKGSQEGWLMPPGAGFRPFPNTLPGLDRFFMIGQWIMPGGGLPSGPMTAKPAIRSICKHDHVPFEIHAELEQHAAATV